MSSSGLAWHRPACFFQRVLIGFHLAAALKMGYLTAASLVCKEAGRRAVFKDNPKFP
jgi:hypothetical protein